MAAERADRLKASYGILFAGAETTGVRMGSFGLSADATEEPSLGSSPAEGAGPGWRFAIMAGVAFILACTILFGRWASFNSTSNLSPLFSRAIRSGKTFARV
jgi:hypothetical protein